METRKSEDLLDDYIFDDNWKDAIGVLQTENVSLEELRNQLLTITMISPVIPVSLRPEILEKINKGEPLQTPKIIKGEEREDQSFDIYDYLIALLDKVKPNFCQADDNRFTPLILAISSARDLNQVKILIHFKADVNVPNQNNKKVNDKTTRVDNKYPLHFAVTANQPEIFEYLLTKEADPSKRMMSEEGEPGKGFTPYELIKELMKRNAFEDPSAWQKILENENKLPLPSEFPQIDEEEILIQKKSSKRTFSSVEESTPSYTNSPPSKVTALEREEGTPDLNMSKMFSSSFRNEEIKELQQQMTDIKNQTQNPNQKSSPSTPSPNKKDNND